MLAVVDALFGGGGAVDLVACVGLLFHQNKPRYEGIELIELYFVEPVKLEPYFEKWEAKWHNDGEKDINNPKIPLKFVRQIGDLVYETNAVAATFATPTIEGTIHNPEEAEE